MGVTSSTCHPSGRQLPTALPRLSRLSSAWCAAAAPSLWAGQWQPCTGWDAVKHRPTGRVMQPCGFPSLGWICVFSFRVQTRACQYCLALPGNVCSGDQDLLSSQGATIQVSLSWAGSFMDGSRAQLSLTRGAAHLCDPRLVFAEKTAAAL